VYADSMPNSFIPFVLAQPNMYLKLWLAVLGILGVALLVRTLKKKPKEEMPPIWDKLQIITALALAVYLLVLPKLGFLISTIIYLMLITSLYSIKMFKEKKTKSQMAKCFAIWTLFSLISVFVVKFVFVQLLDITVPSFSLFKV